jgi:hypothetical protein
MTPVISLSDDELSAITDAARPLRPKLRGEFLKAVAAEIEQNRQCGPGAIYRACRELQRKFFDPPNLSASKYE